MRTILARLALAGVFGIALNGCGGSNGTSLPTGGLPNGAGGGSVQSTNGVGPPPPGTEPVLAVDGGSMPGFAKTYSGVGGTVATDTITPPNPAASPPATGMHSIVLGTAPATTELKYGGTPSGLTYQFGVTGNIATFNYNEIDVVGPSYTGATAPTTVAVELQGGTGGAAYDIRLICGGPALTAAPAAAPLRCLFPTNGINTAPVPAPPYYIANSYGAPSGSYTTAYTAPVAPATVGTFTRPSGPGNPPAVLNTFDAGLVTLQAPTGLWIILSFPAATTGTFTFVGLTAVQ